MTWQLYVSLSGMMFLEFAVWGLWAPVLASRLLGQLGMSGKQTGWIYGTLPLACILSPMVAGQIVDRWCPTEWFLAGVHLVGAVFLFLAARAETFPRLFLLMGAYALCFAPTLALVNSLTFAHLPDPEVNYFWVRVWGAVSWVVAGWLVATWRRWSPIRLFGSDALTLAGVASLVMGVYCLFLPHTPPTRSADAVLPALKAIGMLSDTNFLIFLVLSFVVTTQLQFYFLGTARFLEDLGTRQATIPAAMTLAQIAQVVAMAQILPFVFPRMGFQWTLAAGTAFWLAMYLVYARMRPRWLVIASMAFHGLAYAFFFDAAFIYVNRVAPSDIRGSAQSLYTMATLGIGLFLGTQFTGIVMDRFRQDGHFRWRPIFLVPCLLLSLCAVAFVVLFRGS